MSEALRCQAAGYLSMQLRGLLSKSWHRKYCVFLITPSGCSPQIHIFENESQYKEDSKDKKTFILQQIKDIQVSKEKAYAFVIVMKREKLTFAAEKEHDLNFWMMTLKQELNIPRKRECGGSVASDDEDSGIVFMEENITYESLPSSPTFTVTVEENEAARRLNLHGSYILAVHFLNIAIVEPETQKTLYELPYKNIRKFGKTRNQFQFETGRSCPTGAGQFSFFTEEGFNIYDIIVKNTHRMRSSEDAPQSPLRTSVNMSDSSLEKKGAPTMISKSSPTPHADPKRTSLKSHGHTAPIHQELASKLNTVLKHRSDAEEQETKSSHSSSEKLDEDIERENNSKKEKHEEEKKEKQDSKKEKHEEEKKEKQDSKKEKHEERKKDKQNSKKDKKAAEMQRKLEEQERKAAEKAEKQAKKERERAQKEKNKKKKGEDKETSKQESSDHSASIDLHAYEEVEPTPSRNITCTAPEPLYAEADDTTLRQISNPRPSAPLKPQTTQPVEAVLYSTPEKVKKDAWKQQGRVEYNVHEEDYDLIKSSMSDKKSNVYLESVYVDSQSIPQEDDTYDHVNCFGESGKRLETNIYGMASGKPISNLVQGKEKPIHMYEEPECLQDQNLPAKKNPNVKKSQTSSAAATAYEKPVDTAIAKNKDTNTNNNAVVKSHSARVIPNAYEEPKDFSTQPQDTKAKKSAVVKQNQSLVPENLEPEPTLMARLPPEGENEESIYNNIR